MCILLLPCMYCYSAPNLASSIINLILTLTHGSSTLGFCCRRQVRVRQGRDSPTKRQLSRRLYWLSEMAGVNLGTQNTCVLHINNEQAFAVLKPHSIQFLRVTSQSIPKLISLIEKGHMSVLSDLRIDGLRPTGSFPTFVREASAIIPSQSRHEKWRAGGEQTRCRNLGFIRQHTRPLEHRRVQPTQRQKPRRCWGIKSTGESCCDELV